MSQAAIDQVVHFGVADAKPIVVREGRRFGENGVTVSRVRLPSRGHMRVTAPDHWIKFSLGGPTEIDCRIAGRRLSHTLQPGSMAVLPAGADSVAEMEGPVETLMLRISARQVTAAAAERGHLAAELPEKLSGSDGALMRLAAALFTEVRDSYVNGPLFWNEITDRITDHVIENHLTFEAAKAGGSLSAATVRRLAEFIRLNVARPLDVATLSAIAGVSRFHFTRLFSRDVGMTPHRYVIKVRLDEAIRLVRDERLPFAEVAVATGFADQSHLCRWVRRVHGTTLARLAA